MPGLKDRILDPQKIRYLVTGGMNTVFGYAVSVATYHILLPQYPLLVAAVIANILAITFSFISYKIFVFKTSGSWLNEYLKSYIVYGGMAVYGIILLWLLVEKALLSIWLAQLVVTFSSVVISYIGHQRFTFKR